MPNNMIGSPKAHPRAGQVVTIGKYNHFVPNPLPVEPPLQIDGAIQAELEQIITHLNNYQPKASSHLDFIREKSSSVLKTEQVNLKTIGQAEMLTGLIEEQCFADAVYAALEDYRRKNTVAHIISETIRHAHGVLMNQRFGKHKEAGNFRKGTASIPSHGFVGAPASLVPKLVKQLEAYLAISPTLHPLIVVALAFSQFVLIHPFGDGNGRAARLLTILLFEHFKLPFSASFDLTYYFHANKREYQQSLNALRMQGDYEGWVIFFLKMVFIALQSDDETSLPELI